MRLDRVETAERSFIKLSGEIYDTEAARRGGDAAAALVKPR